MPKFCLVLGTATAKAASCHSEGWTPNSACLRSSTAHRALRRSTPERSGRTAKAVFDTRPDYRWVRWLWSLFSLEQAWVVKVETSHWCCPLAMLWRSLDREQPAFLVVGFTPWTEGTKLFESPAFLCSRCTFDRGSQTFTETVRAPFLGFGSYRFGP